MECRFQFDPRIQTIINLLTAATTIDTCPGEPGASITAPKLDAIAQAIGKVGAESCSKSTCIPEWWQVRIGADRPQFVIQFGKVEAGGRMGSSRWSLTIPHYKHAAGFKPNIPTYSRGQHFAVYTCKDNSKLIIHCKSRQEIDRVLPAFLACIKDTQKPAIPKIHYGERTGQVLTVAIVKPTIGHYYATGQKNLKPNWSVSFRG